MEPEIFIFGAHPPSRRPTGVRYPHCLRATACAAPNVRAMIFAQKFIFEVSDNFDRMHRMSKKNLKKFSCFLIFISLCSRIFAAPITKFNFYGLKKTDQSYLQHTLEVFLQQEDTPETLHNIETVLQAEGIFEEILIHPEEIPQTGQTQINITLKEKITFIPVPFAAVSNGKFMGGAIVMNMNAFGNKTMLMSGAMFSSTETMALFAISKQPETKNSLGYSLFTGFSRQKIRLANLRDEDFLELNHIGAKISVALQKKLSDSTMVSLGIGGSGGYVKQFEDKTSLTANLSGELNHGKNDWNGWFLNIRALKLSGEVHYDFFKNTPFQKAKGEIIFQHPLTQRLRLCSSLSQSMANNASIIEWSGENSVGITILPTDFKSPNISGATAGLELALKKFNFGLISLYGNYQAVYAEDTDENFEFCQGVACGTRLYLSKIAFPAFALGVSRNFTTRDFFWSVSLGASF